MGQVERLAKLLTYNCMRYTFLEVLHSGKPVRSEKGDFSDVKVVTPYGEIPWNEISRITNDEMKTLNKDLVNKVFTFLLHYQEEAPPIGPNYLWYPNEWDSVEMDKQIKSYWDHARNERSKTQAAES